MNNLIYISDFIFNGYLFTVPLLLIACKLFSSYKQSFQDLIIFSNIFILVASIIFIINTATLYFNSYDSPEAWEKSLYFKRTNSFYFIGIAVSLIIKGLLPQLFWMKKVRNNEYFSIFIVVTLIFNFFIPTLISSNEYLKTSLKFDVDFKHLGLHLLLYLVLLIFSCFVSKKISTLFTK